MPEQIALRARFDDYAAFEHVLHKLKEMRLQRYEAFGPTNLEEIEHLMPEEGSPVRWWATTGAIIGLFSFWIMCWASALIYKVIVWGKPPWSNVPYVIPAYEGTILFGSIFAFVAVLFYAKLKPRIPANDYAPEFSEDNYGVVAYCDVHDRPRVENIFNEAGALEITTVL